MEAEASDYTVKMVSVDSSMDKNRVIQARFGECFLALVPKIDVEQPRRYFASMIIRWTIFNPFC